MCRLPWWIILIGILLVFGPVVFGLLSIVLFCFGQYILGGLALAACAVLLLWRY